MIERCVTAKMRDGARGARYVQLHYAGRLRFRGRGRVCEVEFPDFPGFHPRAAVGRDFQARIQGALASHIAGLRAGGAAPPAPSAAAAVEAGEGVVRWFAVEIAGGGRGAADRAAE